MDNSRCNYPRCTNDDVQYVVECDVSGRDPERIPLCAFHRRIRDEIIATTVRFPTTPPLPMKPLREYLWSHVCRFGHTFTSRAISPHRVTKGDLWRYLNHSKEIARHQADRLCIRLGTHPAALWPDAWLIAESRKRKPRPRKPPRTACRRGHPYEGDNFYVDSKGTRVCRVCRRERDRARSAA